MEGREGEGEEEGETKSNYMMHVLSLYTSTNKGSPSARCPH